MKGFILLGALLCCTSSFGELTKSSISQEVKALNEAIQLKMKQTGNNDCQNVGKDLIFDFNQAQAIFLSDNYSKAIWDNLKVIENSSRKAYGYPRCPTGVIARSISASQYLLYFFQQKKLFNSYRLRSLAASYPTDGERAVLLSKCQNMSADLTKFCKASICSDNEKKIIVFANVLITELSKSMPSVEKVTLWLLAIKSHISQGYGASKQPQTLRRHHNELLQMLYTIQPYLFKEEDLIVPKQTQAHLLELALKEKQPDSICAALLYQYYSTLFRDHSAQTVSRLVTYLYERNKLFELLNDAIYARAFHNDTCAIDKYTLFDIAFQHAAKVRSELYAALNSA